MTLSAIFYPIDPEASVCDLVNETRAGMLAGLRLYTDGKRFALLPRPLNGWALFGTTITQPRKESPCAA